MRHTTLALAVCGALLTSAPVSATDPCSEYLDAEAVKKETFRLLERQPDNEVAAELASETAERWRQAREAVIAGLRAEGDDQLESILASWEKLRNESEIAVASTLFWFMLAPGQSLDGKASAEFMAVSDALDAIYAAEHATIAQACSLSAR